MTEAKSKTSANKKLNSEKLAVEAKSKIGLSKKFDIWWENNDLPPMDEESYRKLLMWLREQEHRLEAMMKGCYSCGYEDAAAEQKKHKAEMIRRGKEWSDKMIAQKWSK